MASHEYYGRGYLYEQEERMRRAEIDRQRLMMMGQSITHTSSGGTINHFAIEKNEAKKKPEGITDEEIYYSLIN